MNTDQIAAEAAKAILGGIRETDDLDIRIIKAACEKAVEQVMDAERKEQARLIRERDEAREALAITRRDLLEANRTPSQTNKKKGTMKLRYIPIALLFTLVGTLAYFGITGPTIDNQWKGCPNVTWRVQIPVPVAPELQYRLEIDKTISEINKEIPLVTTARLPRDVHEAEVQQKPESVHQMW